MKYTTLLFDADGTLFDFDKTEEISLQNFYRKVNLSCPYEEFHAVYERENRLLWEALERGEVTAEEVKVGRFVNTMEALGLYEGNGEELSALFIEELAHCGFLLEGAESLIASLHPHYELYIITNGLWDVQRRRLGDSPMYRNYFKGMTVSEKVGSAKPSKGIFDEAFKLAGHPSKEKVMIIGDSLTSDIRGGNLYEIDTCWFNPMGKERGDTAEPTYTVNSFREMEELLLEI